MSIVVKRQEPYVREFESLLVLRAEMVAVDGQQLRVLRSVDVSGLVGIGIRASMAPEELRLRAMPAGLGVEEEAVQVEDDSTESPRERWDRIRASGAICWTGRPHSGGSSR